MPTMIYASATYGHGLRVLNNSFAGGGFGIVVNGPSTFYIHSNNFTFIKYGTQAENTYLLNNYILCNVNDRNLTSGIVFAGSNGSLNTGVQFLQNTFSGNPTDVSIFRSKFSGLVGSVHSNQGSPVRPSQNCFTPNSFPLRYQTMQFLN